jgi:(2Fe-2S) ferredoxin
MTAPYEQAWWVCTGGKTCPRQGSEAIHAALKDAVHAAGLGDRVRVSKSGCLAQCGHGPMVVCYPEGAWYAAVTPEKVKEIVASHVVGGKPVEALLYRPGRSGKNIVEAGVAPGTLPLLPLSPAPPGGGAAGPPRSGPSS